MIDELFNLDNLEEKKIKLKINSIEEEILELKALLNHIEKMFLILQISLIENEYTEEDLVEMIKDFNRNPKTDEELLEIEESFYSDVPDEEGKLTYSCDTDSENFNIFVMSVYGRYVKGNQDLTEKISVLRTEKIKLQKELVSKIESERKYKELLKDVYE